MSEIPKKNLISNLGEAMMSINSAECFFINFKNEYPIDETDLKHREELSAMWYRLYHIKKYYNDGLGSIQSKGEPEKTR